MKIYKLMIYCMALLVLATSCYALCKEPDLIKQRQCLAKCETGLVMQASCAETCNEEMNDYIKCVEAEQKAREDQAAEGKKGTAKVTSIRGNLKITRKDGTVETVTSDAIIQYGDTIETQAGNGHATITLSDGSSFRLSPGARMMFDAQMERKCPGSQLGIILMKLKARVKHIRAGAQWEVRTPQACCCVRGTEFLVDYDDVKGITKVYLYEGALDVINVNDETFALNSGEMMTLDSNGNVNKASLSEEEWDSIAQSIEQQEYILPSPAETDSEEQKTGKPAYMIIIAIVVILIGAFIIKKGIRKKSQKA